MAFKSKMRQDLADKFIELLDKEGLEWKQGWENTLLLPPVNGVTGDRYKLGNAFTLMLTAHTRGYSDSRWFTYNQISAHNLSVYGSVLKEYKDELNILQSGIYDDFMSGTQKEKNTILKEIMNWSGDIILPLSGRPIGETLQADINNAAIWRLENARNKGVPLEYVQPYDLENKKFISWGDYEMLPKDEKEECAFRISNTWYVFNGNLVSGLGPDPNKKQEFTRNINSSELVKEISEGMNVPIKNNGGNSAYYSPDEDVIHLPVKESFYDDAAYESTALHELAHSTGHETRLNRDIRNNFGSDKYAFEELVAEITSMFMSQFSPTATMTDEHIASHAAYVQSWKEQLKKDPNTLIRALTQSEKAAEYMCSFSKSITLELQQTVSIEQDKVITDNEPDQAPDVIKNDNPVQAPQPQLSR